MGNLPAVQQERHPITAEQVESARQRIAGMPNLMDRDEPIHPDDLWEAGMPIVVLLGALVIELLVYAAMQAWWF